jgi:hypothetical protein
MVARELPSVAPAVDNLFRELAGESENVELNAEAVEDSVKDAVKEAVKEAVRGAVEEAFEKTEGAPKCWRGRVSGPSWEARHWPVSRRTR